MDNWKSNSKLIAEWDSELNGSINEFVGRGKVWWKCNKCICKSSGKAMRYLSSVSDRDRQRGCPYCQRKTCDCGCNSLFETNLELRDEWDSVNDDMKKYRTFSSKKVWWTCRSCICQTTQVSRRWQATICDRVLKNSGCPYCYHKVCDCGCNSLYYTHPHLREQWNNEKNGSMKLYSSHSGKKVWWRCMQMCSRTGIRHEWMSKIDDRTSQNQDCPICSGRTRCICGCNSVYELFPNLRDEWDSTRNKDMKLYSPTSKQSVWWICKKRSEHKWYAPIGNRTGNGTGCPYCRRSMMEETMATVLNELEIVYTHQEKAMIEGRTLRFDFYLPDYNTYIECQGCQHFHRDYYFHSKDDNSFDDLAERDLNKVIYVKDQQSSFISIAYTVSLKEYKQLIVNALSSILGGLTYKFYYSETYFWSVENDCITIPEFKDKYIPEIAKIYQHQLEMITG